MTDVLCNFAQIAPGRVRCTRCPNTLRSDDPTSCFARCRAAANPILTSPCVHQQGRSGDEVRCKGCSGSPRVHALFGCALHGACLPFSRIPNVPWCGNCPDYSPSIPE